MFQKQTTFSHNAHTRTLASAVDAHEQSRTYPHSPTHPPKLRTSTTYTSNLKREIRYGDLPPPERQQWTCLAIQRSNTWTRQGFSACSSQSQPRDLGGHRMQRKHRCSLRLGRRFALPCWRCSRCLEDKAARGVVRSSLTPCARMPTRPATSSPF